ncbi:MAG TPA: adenylate/guanylate cyclase domain-containing protein [Pantanalinema sp.]
MRLFRRTPASEPAPRAQAAGGFGAIPVGAFCDVTVLFADLEGFTAMTEQLPAPEVVVRLNETFSALTDAVDRFGGRVDKFMGDAMLVVWSEADPCRSAALAVQAAIAMQAEAALLQARALGEGRRPVKVRIGISSGRAVIGEIGAPQRRETTVIGDAVNTASRLEALNKDFHTDSILSGATRELAGDRLRARDLGMVTIKGRREPVRAFALVAWDEKGAR